MTFACRAVMTGPATPRELVPAHVVLLSGVEEKGAGSLEETGVVEVASGGKPRKLPPRRVEWAERQCADDLVTHRVNSMFGVARMFAALERVLVSSART
ncbi:hypothetical protein [Streptomyces sp. NPDC005760]|uniref:hypothetical protein n=1 Tax=Streptomyces sp. NPDC005760 TaxID=3156718 RepID=UPI0033F8E060